MTDRHINLPQGALVLHSALAKAKMTMKNPLIFVFCCVATPSLWGYGH